ncbi:hypothetical protein CPB86DRAFT_877125 [Serendipita vermifera]|nr:hypothetical protein CPB86DRAFT_877125 [Serendipita vermifera]
MSQSAKHKSTSSSKSRLVNILRHPGSIAQAALLDSSSLSPSRLVDLSLASSIGPRGNDLLRVSFPYTWETSQGPVFDWYGSQPVTSFRSLQHRKDRAEPFCHEFVVLRLTNGSLCRIERRCDPNTTTAALARHGTTAHDFVQVWPAEYLNELDESSDVVAEIEYPEEFDIRDVLSLCYAVHQDHEAKQYSLQRYNCYFFCWSIVSFLARRTAKWEQLFTEAAWQELMHTTSKTMEEISSCHDPELHPHDLAFRVTRLLSEDNEAPSQFLLDALQFQLAKEDTRSRVCTAISGIIWSQDATAVVEKNLATVIKEAARNTTRYPTVGATILEGACSGEMINSARGIMDMQELRLVREQWGSRYHRAWREQAQAALEEYHDEHPVGVIESISRGMKLALRTVTGALNGARGSFLACISEGPDVSKRIRNEWLRKQARNVESEFRSIGSRVHMAWSISKFVTRVVTTYARTGAMGARVDFMNSDTGNKFPCAPDWIDMTDASISGALDVARKAGIDGPEFVRACILRTLDGSTDFTTQRSMEEEVNANMCKKWDQTWQNWVTDSVGEPLARLISTRMGEIEKQSIKITFPAKVQTSPLAEKTLVSGSRLHEMIQGYIIAHGQRVSRHQLGSERRIITDIEHALARIWSAIPSAA